MKLRLPFGLAKSAPPLEIKETISLNQLAERMAAVGASWSGVSVRPDNAMRCTTVQGIVRALTNAVGSFPVSIVQTKEQGGKPVTMVDRDHAGNRLLLKPNYVHTSTEFFRLVMEHVALYGNFYALKGQGQSGPIQFLKPVTNPDAVSIESVNWGSPGVVYRVNNDGESMLIPQDRIVHITCGILGEDGITGISPVREAKQAIGICLAAEQLIAQLYGNNDIPTMALIGGQFQDKEAYDLWAQKFKEARGAISEGRGGTLLLPEGMDAKEMSFKPVDAQLLEMRKFQRLEIAQVYGVPPHKLADLERATFSNIEEQSLEFVRDVAKPYVRLMQQALTRDLLTVEDQRAGYWVRFDMEDATEGKLADRLTAFGKAHQIGAMNPNEIRERLGMNPRTDPGGDEYVTALNMRPSNDDSSNESDSGSPPDADDAAGDAESDAARLRSV